MLPLTATVAPGPDTLTELLLPWIRLLGQVGLLIRFLPVHLQSSACLIIIDEELDIDSALAIDLVSRSNVYLLLLDLTSGRFLRSVLVPVHDHVAELQAEVLFTHLRHILQIITELFLLLVSIVDLGIILTSSKLLRVC